MTTSPTQSQNTTNTTIPNIHDDDTVQHSNLSSQKYTKSKPIPSWIQNNTRITIKLPKSNNFTKGFLHKLDDTSWTVTLSRSRKSTNITHINDKTLLELYNNGSLLQGHSHKITSPQPNTINKADATLPTPTIPT